MTHQQQVAPDFERAVRELRELKKEDHKRQKAARRGVAYETGRELARWQKSLGEGNFFRAYSKAGWMRERVKYCLKVYKNQQDSRGKFPSQHVENKRDSERDKEVVQDFMRSARDKGPAPENRPAWDRPISNAEFESALTGAMNPDEDAMEFLRLLDFEALQRAYRATAEKLHPDKGGDSRQMTKLNRLWQAVKEQLKQLKGEN